MNAALQALDLRVDLGGQEVLHEVNLTLPAGRWTSIVGPNGAGKSTLLKALSGLLPAQGQVHWFGQPMAGIARRERGQQLSWLGQGEGASDDLRVSDVVMLGRLPFQDWLSAPSALDQQMVESALKATQAWDWRDRTLGQLSGGERQRVLLARALAVNAPIMLMDEPLANLDPPHQVDWLEQVHCLLAQGTTVVSVLHEIGMALHADDVVVMQAGRVVHHGACADEATQRAIESVFDQRIRIVSVDGQSVALPRV
ncbi:ABC transporter ATP-binding protein [Limnohabitans sp.]|uniref:ABC transporter ATP-binding protein n=1 Tax=Limnohabitans sp. TaxID=1907725 RepID=UPI0025BEF219|nr:ABC transporter ATP-binding protein [Limnohabitans sp.]